jgi:hypothetical protein
MDEEAVEKVENKETLCLSSGMGGHAGAFVNVKIKDDDNIYCGKLINPGDTRELEFYKFMNDNADKPFYGTFNQFIPQLHGIVAVKNSANIDKIFGLEYKYNYYYCIALDNMKKDIKDPVFIDIKIGAYTAKNAGIKKEAQHKIINDKQWQWEDEAACCLRLQYSLESLSCILEFTLSRNPKHVQTL